jgi:hypothetical protein
MATAKTTTPQDPGAKALNTARSRALTAAKKALGLIEEAVAKHKADLEAGNAPDATLTASALKYEGLRAVLEAFGKLAGGEPVVPEPAAPVPARQEDAVSAGYFPDPAQVRQDITELVTFITGTFPNMVVSPGTPLQRLQALTFPPVAGAGTPAANGQDQVRQVTEALTGEGTTEVAAALAASDGEPPY